MKIPKGATHIGEQSGKYYKEINGTGFRYCEDRGWINVVWPLQSLLVAPLSLEDIMEAYINSD